MVNRRAGTCYPGGCPAHIAWVHVPLPLLCPHMLPRRRSILHTISTSFPPLSSHAIEGRSLAPSHIVQLDWPLFARGAPSTLEGGLEPGEFFAPPIVAAPTTTAAR